MTMEDKCNYKLTYFDIRGRAEGIRLLFARAAVPFTDNRLQGAEWPSLKSKTRWGQLPLLHVEGEEKPIAQSLAIVRFLAKKFGLYSQDHFTAAKIDELGYAITELVGEWFKYHFESDGEKKSAQKASLLSTHFPKYFEAFSKVFLENGGQGPFLLGEKEYFADILLADLLDAVECEEGFGGIVEQYPVVKGIKDAVFQLQGIKEYVETRK